MTRAAAERQTRTSIDAARAALSEAAAALQRELRRAGLCTRCSAPHARKTALCIACTRKAVAAKRAKSGVCRPHHCRICKQFGHNARTCPQREES